MQLPEYENKAELVIYLVLVDPSTFDVVDRDTMTRLVFGIRSIVDQTLIEYRNFTTKFEPKTIVPFDRELFGDMLGAALLGSKSISKYKDMLNFSVYYPEDDGGYLDNLVLVVDSPYALLDKASKESNEHNFHCPSFENYLTVN